MLQGPAKIGLSLGKAAKPHQRYGHYVEGPGMLRLSVQDSV
jgi:hypothetical protein